MTSPRNIAATFDAAADRLIKYGWFGNRFPDQHQYPNPECAAIAISRSFDSDDISWTSARFNTSCQTLADFLGLDPPADYDGTSRGIVTWNNASGRTKEEVIQALRDCAEKLRMSEEA